MNNFRKKVGQVIYARVGYLAEYIENGDMKEIANRNILEHMYMSHINNAKII